MKKSTPALSHQPPKGIDGEKYESLAGLIEPYADGQFAELLEGLCERVIEAFSPHSWDELTPFQRHSLARDDDAEHDPTLKIDRDAGMHIGYYGLNHVQAWLTMGAVAPRNAALVFFGKNPSKYKSNLPDMGEDFDLMDWSFEDAARDGHVRSLNDWLILARSRNLNAVGLDGWEACATIAARATDTAPPAPVAALGDETQSTDGIRYEVLASRTELIEAFSLYGVELKIFRALKDRPGLMAACRVKGQGQKGSRAEPMFCPFEVINWLVKTGVKEKPRLTNSMGWHILQTRFPSVYAEKSVGDPRQN